MSEPKTEPKTSAPMSEKSAERPQLPVEVFHEMERRDENQILAEMRGDLAKEFVYDFKVKGRRVVNLSFAGIREAARRRGGFEIVDYKLERQGDEIWCVVKVRDLERKVDAIGAAQVKAGEDFALPIVTSKAQRNAYQKLLPTKWIATLIDEWLRRQNREASISASGRISEIEPVETWTPHVPVTKDPVAVEGLKQYPLIDGTTAIGMLSALEDGSQVSIVPERPIKADDPAIANFLIPRILDQIAAKHPEFQYQLVKSGDGLLTAIVVRGKLEEHQIRELASAAKWSFQRALEKEKQPV